MLPWTPIHTKKVNIYQYLPILMYCDLECEGQHLLLLNLFAWGLNMLPFLPCQKTVKKDGIAVLDCWTKKYIACQRCLGHSNSKIDIRRGTGKTIKCFRAEWSCILNQWNISFQSATSAVIALRRHPGSQAESSPFYLWHGTYSILLHKILFGLVYLKTSSGIGFNGLWLLLKKMRKLRKVWEKSKFISSRRSLYSMESWNPL